MAVFNGATNSFDGTISQTFPTVSGQTYTLSLDMGIAGVNGKILRMQVTVAGGSALISQQEQITKSGSSTFWAPRKNYTFTADSTSTTLTLSDASSTVTPSTSATDADLLVDNVVVADAISRTLAVKASPASRGLMATERWSP
jgi:hypothetical protein